MCGVMQVRMLTMIGRIVHDDERAQKKMDKFKKSILRMKEDAND